MNNYERLIRILRCPVCFSDLYLGKEELICLGCGRRYRIVNGIVDMLQPIDLTIKER
ncbi:Trm112 family protein [bacterium]|nr:Trm112 family protein [bacterium]